MRDNFSLANITVTMTLIVQLVVSCLVILQLNSASGVPTQLCKAHNKQYVGGDLEALVDVTTTADCINACLKVTGANHWQFVRHIWMENNSVDNICHCKDTTGLTATACTSMNCDIEGGSLQAQGSCKFGETAFSFFRGCGGGCNVGEDDCCIG